MKSPEQQLPEILTWSRKPRPLGQATGTDELMDASGRESGPHNASSDLCKFEDELILGGRVV
jgi:hypothetical protein